MGFLSLQSALALDIIAPMVGARKYRASKWGIIGASFGLLVGIFTFGFWGVILGPFVGALVGELIYRREWVHALKSASGTVIGFVAGTLLKIVIVLIMIGFFVASWF